MDVHPFSYLKSFKVTSTFSNANPREPRPQNGPCGHESMSWLWGSQEAISGRNQLVFPLQKKRNFWGQNTISDDFPVAIKYGNWKNVAFLGEIHYKWRFKGWESQLSVGDVPASYVLMPGGCRLSKSP